jgi:putative transposase
MTYSNYNPKIHNRQSNRLKGYDYSACGLYFITICCQNMEHRFGNVVKIKNLHDAIMDFNEPGNMVNKEWLNLKTRFPNIELHEFQTMPNHFHGIIEILDVADGHRPTDDTEKPKNNTICDMMDAFKSLTTVAYINGVKNLNWPQFDKKLWQRNFHDHIIRNETEYIRISNYILNNPSKWHEDKFNQIMKN